MDLLIFLSTLSFSLDFSIFGPSPSARQRDYDDDDDDEEEKSLYFKRIKNIINHDVFHVFLCQLERKHFSAHHFQHQHFSFSPSIAR
jgi:hypothetical protein